METSAFVIVFLVWTIIFLEAALYTYLMIVPYFSEVYFCS